MKQSDGEEIIGDESKIIIQNVASALSTSFFASNYVDLRTHTYIIISAMDYTKKMLVNCDTMEKAFDSFINTLVKPEFQGKMREFCNSDTIAERVKNKKHIDCEYLSNVAVGWCRASFFPTEWDENGDVTHVLFAVSSIDDNMVKQIEEGLSSRMNLQAVFDNVPGGIILYEWDGKELKILQISKYYEELYGQSMLNDTGKPDFMRVHPDDLADYQAAIATALNETHHLEYVFRVWNQKRNRYCYTQINAVSIPQEDGTSLVFAMYTDVTEQKKAQLQLKKSNASIMAALGAAEQYSYEYDPKLHTSTDFMDTDNGYHLGKVIYNYPECFRESDFMHPEDVELFIDTVHKIDNGAKSAQCDIRVYKDDVCHWHSCNFEAFYDSEKERNVALLTVVDVTPKMIAMQNYKKRLKALTTNNKDAMCMCDVNVTKNRFANVHAVGIIKECGEKARTADEFIKYAAEAVTDVKQREEYKALFNCENLLAQFEKGNNHIKLEHYYKIDELHTEWVETVFELVSDPVTNDVVGICYARSLNSIKLSRMLLDASLENDYPMAAFVYASTGEYYMYEVDRKAYCEHKQDYWGNLKKRLESVVNFRDIDDVSNSLSKECVVTSLENKNEYIYSFNGMYQGRKSRLQAKYSYADKEHGLIIATLRDITDADLYKQYKYESEHDSLTGLLNRHSLFLACRKLLFEHPDDNFAMIHCDVRHFHLFNTFFGEEEGDRLLVKIAQLIANIGRDYKYWAYGRIEADVFCTFFPINEDRLRRNITRFFDEVSKMKENFPIEPIIGVYKVTDPSMPIEAMFTRATIAAKQRKNNMFDKITMFDEVMEQELQNTHQITSDMHTAIEKEQFEVYLQPKYLLNSEKLIGAEALVRWKHPQKGMISPGQFIPVFEKNGFIAELDRYMWEHVCSLLKRWSDEGKTIYPVSVNMSRISMYSRTTVPFLIDLIEKYNLEPKYLELELTESAYMDDPEDLKRMLKELQNYGFKILMDDFGSGYSSLNTLRELPVDVLKLDMKFLSETQNDSRGQAVLSSVVRMSKMLELPIVAEGVEKREQAEYLCSLGCEYAQGYLFAKPMPATDYEKLLSEK